MVIIQAKKSDGTYEDLITDDEGRLQTFDPAVSPAVGITSDDGNVGGTTVIDTTRTEPNDHWNGMALLITSGAQSGQLKEIVTWVLATGTFTVAGAFGGQILEDVTYKILAHLPALPAANTDEQGSFLWDTSAYTTVEQDISALFTTPLTGATRRRYSLFLDLTQVEADAAAWTECTLKVKVEIDGVNPRTVDKKVLAKTDVAAGEEPGVPIDIPAVAKDVQVTMQFNVALGADQTIYYHYVREALE